MSLFMLSEFIEIAARDEDTGAAFYKALADHTKDQNMKAAFTAIGAQEQKHAATFRSMLSAVSSAKVREEYAGQYESYLKALLETRAFTTVEKATQSAMTFKSDLDAIEAALRMEKDTLLFYGEMLQFLPAANNPAVHSIMDEEKQHLRDLQALKG